MHMANLVKLIMLLTLFSCVSIFGLGCGEEVVEQPKQVVQKPKPKPKPKAKAVEQLMLDYAIDNRVVLTEDDAPKKETSRIAILQFFDAMLKTDVTRLGGMLSFGDKLELDVMMNAGLESTMQQVSLVELKTGRSPEGRDCVMGVFEINLKYQLQIWYFKQADGVYTFEAAETAPNLVNKLSGDWMSNYFTLKAKQIEIADQPDEETSYTLAGETTTTDGGLGNGGGPPRPGGPGGPRSPGGPKGPGR